MEKLYCISYTVLDFYQYEETDYYTNEELVDKLRELLEQDLQEFNLQVVIDEEE